MAFSLPLSRAVPLIDPAAVPVYDCADPYPDEGDLSLELPGPRARYEQLAADIRSDIYKGAYAVGSVLPTETELAEPRGISRALVNRALQLVAGEELISQVQGRGTTVLPRRIYRVGISVPFPAGTKPGSRSALRKAIGSAADAEPAVAKVESADLDGGAATVALLVEAADGDWAVHAAKLVLRSAGKPWSWVGWDLTLASYQCDPAEA